MPRPATVWKAAAEPETSLADSALGIDSRLGRLLARRGLEDEDEVRRFLTPSLSDLHDPNLLAGVPEAVERLLAAREAGEKVAIVGDYDVDGVSATAMLLKVFRACGLEADSILPNRMAEGYGFQPVHVDRAEAAGTGLIVTADCGSSSVEAATSALERGISVIVTDHHIPSPGLDPRVIQINPHQEACDYPFPELSGAGLAFKLAMAVARAAGREVNSEFTMSLLRVACLGTIADLVPLSGENRTIAALGLEALDTTPSAGLKALIQVSGVRHPVRAGDVGFRLGPRLNAAGRMDRPDPALELLMERDDPVRGKELAESLNRWNEERQAFELAAVEQARAHFLDLGTDLPRLLMAWSPDWHRGVLGIAAGRLAREFHRPAILLSVVDKGDGDGNAVGSGRSVRGIHLHDFLTAFENRFVRFGGHAQAIGISIETDLLEDINRDLQKAAEAWDPALLIPTYEYEEHLEVETVTLDLVRQLDRLEPYGMANRKPLFRVGPLELTVPPRHFGKNHLGLRGKDKSGATLDMVAWRWAERAEMFTKPFEVLGHVKLDSYLGRASLEVVEARRAAD